MAVIKSGTSSDQWTIDPLSKAGRVTLYDVNGNPFSNSVTITSPATQVWKQVEPNSTQAALVVWAPATGKSIAVTSFEIFSGGNIVVTLWFGNALDATFTQGTDQPLFRGNTTNGGFYPFHFITPRIGTVDFRLILTSSANGQLYITVYGYEI